MPEATRRANNRKSKVQSRVEHVFAEQKGRMVCSLEPSASHATTKTGLAISHTIGSAGSICAARQPPEHNSRKRQRRRERRKPAARSTRAHAGCVVRRIEMRPPPSVSRLTEASRLFRPRRRIRNLGVA